ncbi:hypothetical protein BSL78_30062 [Apostichopus japonicus]|uniref:Uncharacterized protein n=1 Tax=Stichopus japonicus TaxID=307972 RepID=A0A2G8JBK5_STIJA|nr:hypothetical protein BSL78_30062 [Apostichopus japonicus]
MLVFFVVWGFLLLLFLCFFNLLPDNTKEPQYAELRAVLECATQVAKSFGILLNKCQETQFELGSVLAFEESRDSSFYLQSYERTLSIIGNVRQGIQEMRKISTLILRGLNAHNNISEVFASTKLLCAALSTIGLSSSTSNLLPSNSQNSLSASSLESTCSSSSSSGQPYKPSELAYLASRQAMSVCQALQRTLKGSQGCEDEDEVFMDTENMERHVHFQDPTSKDVLLVTKYSHNQNEVGTSID